MRTKKIIAMMTAVATIAGSAISMQASAATYAIGDVDMDGVVTGHDTALVSRAVTEDLSLLNEEQQTLADMNGDGVVDNADVAVMQAEEVYTLGDVARLTVSTNTLADGTTVKCAGVSSAYVILQYTVATSAGKTPELSQVDLNLMDVNADGTVTYQDAYAQLISTVCASAGMSCFEDGIYYMTSNVNNRQTIASSKVVTLSYPDGTNMNVVSTIRNA